MKFKIARKTDLLLILLIPFAVVAIYSAIFMIQLGAASRGDAGMPRDMVSNGRVDFSRRIHPRPTRVLDGNLLARNDDSWKVYGKYSPVDGTVSFDKILLYPDYENLRLSVLRHEYGHVLMDDMIRDSTPGSGFPQFLRSQIVFLTAKFVNQRHGEFIVDNLYPVEMRNIYAVYRSQGKSIYGQEAYSGDNFAEFFAEGYSSFLNNYRIPEELKDSYAGIADK